MTAKLKIHTLEEGEWVQFYPEVINYEWCCDCRLRHITEYRIVKDKDGEPVVEQRSWRDSYATDLRRSYERLKKRSKK